MSKFQENRLRTNVNIADTTAKYKYGPKARVVWNRDNETWEVMVEDKVVQSGKTLDRLLEILET